MNPVTAWPGAGAGHHQLGVGPYLRRSPGGPGHERPRRQKRPAAGAPPTRSPGEQARATLGETQDQLLHVEYLPTLYLGRWARHHPFRVTRKRVFARLRTEQIRTPAAYSVAWPSVTEANMAGLG